MPARHLVQGPGQLVARPPPAVDIVEPQRGAAPQLRGIEVLVRNGVSPVVELFESLLSLLASPIERLHPVPDREAESPKVRTDVAGIGVASVEFAIAHELPSNHVLQRNWNPLNDVLYALGVQVAAKAPELRGQEHSIGVVDLLCRITAPTSRSSNGAVRAHDLVKLTALRLAPVQQGVRGHFKPAMSPQSA